MYLQHSMWLYKAKMVIVLGVFKDEKAVSQYWPVGKTNFIQSKNHNMD